MSYSAVLFDLDGTLTESGIGITKSVAYALEKMGYSVPDQQELNRFVGPPLFHGFQEIGGTTEEDAIRGEAIFHERYDVIGWKENRVYDGIMELLDKLKEANCYLAIASSKPQIMVDRVTGYFGLAEKFDKIIGTMPGNKNSTKDRLIRSALPEGIDLSKAAMVGDRKFDMAAASAVGIAAIGVLYGYGSREELMAAGANKIAEDARALEKILLG